MNAFHSSRYLQLKWLFDLSHASMIKVHVQMMQPSILKSHKHSKMIETNFYRLYSIMIGSKIIAGSQSKVWHPILSLLSVLYF